MIQNLIINRIFKELSILPRTIKKEKGFEFTSVRLSKLEMMPDKKRNEKN